MRSLSFIGNIEKKTGRNCENKVAARQLGAKGDTNRAQDRSSVRDPAKFKIRENKLPFFDVTFSIEQTIEKCSYRKLKLQKRNFNYY